MGTRSTITVENPDSTYTSVYCHWDGYLGHHGPILKDHYGSYHKAKLLVGKGDMSSLAERCSRPKGHSYNNPVEGYTVYYGRDRKETGTGARTINSLSEIDEQEYNYVFKDGSWFLLEDWELVPLNEAINRDQED